MFLCGSDAGTTGSVEEVLIWSLKCFMQPDTSRSFVFVRLCVCELVNCACARAQLQTHSCAGLVLRVCVSVYGWYKQLSLMSYFHQDAGSGAISCIITPTCCLSAAAVETRRHDEADQSSPPPLHAGSGFSVPATETQSLFHIWKQLHHSVGGGVGSVLLARIPNAPTNICSTRNVRLSRCLEKLFVPKQNFDIQQRQKHSRDTRGGTIFMIVIMGCFSPS